MNCLDYRRLMLSDPDHRSADAAEHRLGCENCGQFTAQLQQQDRALRAALEVSPPANLESRIMLAAVSAARARRRWYAVAAGAVVGLALSFTLVLQDTRSLHDSVVAHLYHEPELLVPSAEVVAQPQLSAVLKRAGVALTGEVGEVSYAGLCFFRGHLVPHMVVKSNSGPVTVLLLPDEKVEQPIVIAEEGFTGTIVPVKGGSVAVVGSESESVSTVRQQLASAVDWQ